MGRWRGLVWGCRMRVGICGKEEGKCVWMTWMGCGVGILMYGTIY